MKLDTRAFALAVGLIWSSAILIVGLANLVAPSYGRAFLLLAASIYPGYSAGTSLAQVIIGTAYGFVDGTIGGLVFAWLYNWLAACFSRKPQG